MLLMTRLQLRSFLTTAYISANSSTTWHRSTTTCDETFIMCVHCTTCDDLRHSSMFRDPTYATTSFGENLGTYDVTVQHEPILVCSRMWKLLLATFLEALITLFRIALLRFYNLE